MSRRPDIREHSTQAAGRTIRYLEAGSGRPVVLLHAFPLASDMWRPQLERVPDGWRMLAPDLCGFGPAASGRAETLDDFARDVLQWMDVLRIGEATIGGLSMGGYITLAMFEMAPERFSAMVLANTRAGADSAEGRAGRDKMSELVRAEGPEAVAEQMLPKLLGRASHQTRPELAADVRAMISGNTTDGIDGAIQAMKARADRTGLLAAVNRPVLIIAGEEDTLIPLADAEAMHGRLARSQLVVVPRAGHLSNLESPEDFSAALHGFLRANL